MRRTIPRAIIQQIYPPSKSSQFVCETYNGLSRLIRNPNPTSTPATVARFFHQRSTDNSWRVNGSRLVDDIHPTHDETARVVSKLYDFVETGVQCAVRGVEEFPAETDRADNSSTGVYVTIDEISTYERVGRIIPENNRKLEDLRKYYEREQQEIEEECIVAIRNVIESNSKTYRKPR